jgi:two-component system nitrate/nitrite response regulator NarL
MLSKGREPKKAASVSEAQEPNFCALIVDRDPMTGSLLAGALVRDLGCDALAIRSSNLLNTLNTRDCQLVAISADLNGKQGLGFDLIKAVSSAHPGVPVLLLLDQPSQEAVVNGFRSGARGVFCRQQSMPEFLDCVEHVRNGFIWAGKEEASFLLNMLKSIPAPVDLTSDNVSLLTSREAQVVRHAATGKTNKAIASEMSLSEHTIKNYLFRAFEKLGVSSRVELIFYLTTRGHSFSPLEVEQSAIPVSTMVNSGAV